MKKLGILLLVASSLSAASPEVKWESSLEAAMTRARAEHKVIFVDLWTGWCGWCIKLQKETFPSEEAKAALGRVVAVSIKTQEADGKPTRFASLEKTYKVDGYPTLLILDEKGREISRQPGYLPPGPFASWVNSQVKVK
jgi:thioredoxin-related protein